MQDNKSFNPSEDELSLYQETLGVRIMTDDSIVTPQVMRKSGYKEISPSNLDELLLLARQLSGVVNQTKYIGTYHVYFDKSLGTLQKAAEGGYFRGNVVQSDANNRIVGQALLKKTSVTPMVTNAVFSIMSMVTSQHYLESIDSKLTAIDKAIDKLQTFLENEKRSELYANFYYLKQIKETYTWIKSNDLQKQAVIQQIQKIKIDNYSIYKFYRTIFDENRSLLEKYRSSTSKKDLEEISKVINEMGNSVVMCKMALTNYSMAYYFEMILLESTDSEYIKYVKKEISEKVSEHKELSGCYDREVCAFFEQAKAYSPNKYLNLFLASGMSVGAIFIANPLLGAAIAAAINSKSEADKKDAKERVEKAFNDLLVQCRDSKLFTQIEDAINEYDQIVNKRRAKLVVTEEKAYIKFDPDK